MSTENSDEKRPKGPVDIEFLVVILWTALFLNWFPFVSWAYIMYLGLKQIINFCCTIIQTIYFINIEYMLSIYLSFIFPFLKTSRLNYYPAAISEQIISPTPLFIRSTVGLVEVRRSPFWGSGVPHGLVGLCSFCKFLGECVSLPFPAPGCHSPSSDSDSQSSSYCYLDPGDYTGPLQ